MTTLRNVFLSHALLLALAALALLSCGPASEDGVRSELSEVVEPCSTTALARERVLDDRGRCWVNFRGLKSNEPHSHPFKSAPEDCPFACERVGTFFWIHREGRPDETLGCWWGSDAPPADFAQTLLDEAEAL